MVCCFLAQDFNLANGYLDVLLVFTILNLNDLLLVFGTVITFIRVTSMDDILDDLGLLLGRLKMPVPRILGPFFSNHMVRVHRIPVPSLVETDKAIPLSLVICKLLGTIFSLLRVDDTHLTQSGSR